MHAYPFSESGTLAPRMDTQNLNFEQWLPPWRTYAGNANSQNPLSIYANEWTLKQPRALKSTTNAQTFKVPLMHRPSIQTKSYKLHKR
jgi:hypothetical protein